MASCTICEKKFVFRWTDTHGIAACMTCGAPYRIYHYDPETKKRIDKQPEMMLKYPHVSKQYWKEHQRNVAPGAFNIPGSSYEVATQEDGEIFYEWWEKHGPKEEEEQACAG